ncbi:hypothetical protein RJ639_014549 [Escallonia herrerae]|uniref:GPI transamidase component PIG-S n=1 Tax=Escallonia herrerae TaxID=1293975 RepID=A0AA89AKQ7_9ASTE|nr:hypothetical protein RJ639_014549 [Escallonia herrerae]
MAEIAEPAGTSAATSSTAGEKYNSDVPDFDPKTMRRTKPGLKRIFVTLTVFFSFLLGLPFLLKSIEIYRSLLPFRDIDSLSNSIDSTPLLFPCRFHAVFVNFDASTEFAADELGFSIVSHMQKFPGSYQNCGTCGSNYTVSVTLDSDSGCVHNQNVGPAWRCGALKDSKLDENLKNDEDFDEYLESVLGGGCEGSLSNDGKVYTVVVVNRDEGVRAVVGKHRHGWIVGRILEVPMVEKVAEIFVKVFVNGGKEEGVIRSEFMPVGADGKVVLSFSLLNADPNDWIYDWDFQDIDDILLARIVEALSPLANISVESQVLYHTPKSSFAYWDEKQESYIFSTKDLPFFVNSNEWHLDTSIAADGRSKVLHFVVYVPSARECPLLLQLPHGETSMTNGFISPMWGGVVVWNPPGCLRDSENTGPLMHKILPQDLKKVFEVFMGQVRQLFGLKSDGIYVGASGTSTLLASEEALQNGTLLKELDVLSRQHTCFNLLQCGTTLGSLSRLVQSLPRMIIMDEIGKQVTFSLEAAKLSQINASQGNFDASAVSSRQARSLAEDAFYHPSIMSVSYYSFEHCFAVYSPFFLPVSLHVLLAVVREVKRYKQEREKYKAWKAKGR